MPFKFNKLKRNQPAWFNEESLSATEANIYIYIYREREREDFFVSTFRCIQPSPILALFLP